jgi:hypothetical protein
MPTPPEDITCEYLQRYCDSFGRRDVGIERRSYLPSAYATSFDAHKNWRGRFRRAGGRYLLRYLMRRQYRQFATGSPNVNFVTPSPHSPTEAISWLPLPTPTRRDFVLFLDPSSIPEVRGPRRILLGGGIDYILPKGFPVSALVVQWPVPVV